MCRVQTANNPTSGQCRITLRISRAAINQMSNDLTNQPSTVGTPRIGLHALVRRLEGEITRLSAENVMLKQCNGQLNAMLDDESKTNQQSKDKKP